MIGKSAPWYIFILTCIFLLRCVAPLSLVYTIINFCYPTLLRLPHPLAILNRPLQILTLAETLWLFAFYIYREHFLQRPAVHPDLLSRAERHELFLRCFRTIPDYDKYISKWFLDAPRDEIKRENVKDFIRWAFLNTGVPDPAYDDELEEYVRETEEQIGRRFSPGRGDAKCLRLTLDKANTLHRSLIWYFCVFVVDNITTVSLFSHGFRFHSASSVQAFTVFPPRPVTLLGRHDAPGVISYWYRPHTSRTKLPILFVHGIGIGLYPYVNFLEDLYRESKSADGEVGILAVEILPVSFRIAGTVLAKDELCEQLLAILNYHQIKNFVLVSHSYGSIVTTFLLRATQLSNRISSVVLVDPISIMLHLPDVAYNFMARKPKEANEWQLWYFASMDPSVANTLSRRFFWSENILWKEDISDRKATVFLSEQDLIVDTSRVRAYLLENQAPNGASHLHDAGVTNKPNASGRKTEEGPNVVWCTGLDHAQIFDGGHWRALLVAEIMRAASCTVQNEDVEVLVEKSNGSALKVKKKVEDLLRMRCFQGLA